MKQNPWEETAAYHLRNEEYYHELLNQIGQIIGEEAYISDDGTKQDSVLCCKLPELVTKLVQTTRNE